jgi:chromatin segregation and condensation protein Rec8/ScpA/Scc1 (kleisin family)
MRVTQLKLELRDQLQRAQQSPETIDVSQLLNVVEATAAQLPEAQQLQFVGDALLQMAELCAMRASVLMTQWEEASRDPIVEPGFFADVVRQTMAVDLSDLLEPAPVRKRRTKSTSKPEGSIAAPVDKAAVLAIVDQLEADNEETQKQAVLAIAHAENVAFWTGAIAQWLQTAPTLPVSITELSDGLNMPWVEVWLGALFGGFQLDQWGE